MFWFSFEIRALNKCEIKSVWFRYFSLWNADCILSPQMKPALLCFGHASATLFHGLPLATWLSPSVRQQPSLNPPVYPEPSSSLQLLRLKP